MGTGPPATRSPEHATRVGGRIGGCSPTHTCAATARGGRTRRGVSRWSRTSCVRTPEAGRARLHIDECDASVDRHRACSLAPFVIRRLDASSRRRFIARAFTISGALLASACAARYEGYASTGYTTVQVGPPPVYYAYPSVWYRGSYVYLIDGAWYVQRGSRWYRYREEPRELGRYRNYYRSYGRFPSHVRSRVPSRRYDAPPPRRRYDSSPPRRRYPSAPPPRRRR